MKLGLFAGQSLKHGIVNADPASADLLALIPFVEVTPARSNVWRIKFEDIPDNTANIVQFYNTVTDASIAEFTLIAVANYTENVTISPNDAATWATALALYVTDLRESLGLTDYVLSAAVDSTITSAVDITFNTGTSNIGVRIVKGVDVLNDETQVWTAPWVKVEGAGVAALNGSWPPVSILGDSPGWSVNGEAPADWGIYNGGGVWLIQANGGETAYQSTTNTALPYLATFEATDPGYGSAPTVSLTGSDVSYALKQTAIGDLLSRTIQIETATFDFNVGDPQAALSAVPAGKRRVVKSITIRGTGDDLSNVDGDIAASWGGGHDISVSVFGAGKIATIADGFKYATSLIGVTENVSEWMGAEGEVFSLVNLGSLLAVTAKVDVEYYDVDA